MASPSDFIDREKEIELLEGILAGNITERIFALLIKPQQGKSYLLRYLKGWCQQQGIPVALVDFDERQSGVVHYWKFVSTVCDGLGMENFQEVNDVEKRGPAGFTPVFQTGPSGRAGTHFGTKGHFDSADLDSISGRDQIQTGDIVTYYGSQDQSGARQERLMHEMGRAFRSGLSRTCCENRALLLLDTYEQATEETSKWINEWVLGPLLDHYPNLIVVITGRPELYAFFNQPWPWNHLLLLRESLSLPGEKDVRKYLEIHNLQVQGDEVQPFIKAAACDISCLAKLRDVYKRLAYE